ncbi:DUF1120 domain-containing protein [Serratia proteamaculans]|uniref:DUF1120 domain-containing protein n=1 Tax=Serratia proteamaculans TaxID=28151 RepID=UPI0039AFEF43
MKKTLLATTLATITLISNSSAFATDSVDLSVGGTIAPASCTPTLSSGGTFDYGDIKADTLKTGDYTILPEKGLDLSITCDSKAKIALRGMSGRKGSVAGPAEDSSGVAMLGGTVKIPGMGTIPVIGLGLDGSTKIGGYSVIISDATIDGQVADIINRSSQSSIYPSWSTTNNTSEIMSTQPDLRISWAAKGETNPVSFKTMVARVVIKPYINVSSSLNLTKPIKLDGLATLELMYL